MSKEYNNEPSALKPLLLYILFLSALMSTPFVMKNWDALEAWLDSHQTSLTADAFAAIETQETYDYHTALSQLPPEIRTHLASIPPEHLELMAEYPLTVSYWLPLASEIQRTQYPHLDLKLIMTIITIESAGNPRAYNSISGASGLGQFLFKYHSSRFGGNSDLLLDGPTNLRAIFSFVDEINKNYISPTGPNVQEQIIGYYSKGGAGVNYVINGYDTTLSSEQRAELDTYLNLYRQFHQPNPRARRQAIHDHTITFITNFTNAASVLGIPPEHILLPYQINLP